MVRNLPHMLECSRSTIARIFGRLLGTAGADQIKETVGINACHPGSCRHQPQKKAINSVRQEFSFIAGKRVLIVEDSPFNQRLVVEILNSAGALTTSAYDGQEALDMLGKRDFDCILMDMQLPVMDGLQAARRIRQLYPDKDMPIIAMTANTDHADREECLASGMSHFLSKPVSPRTLFACLETCFGQMCRHDALEMSTWSQERLHEEISAINNPDVIDLRVLAEAIGNNPEKILKFARSFQETVRKSLKEIDQALQQKDYVRLSALGHRTKSSARAVGALKLSDMLESLESLKEDDGFGQAIQIVEELRSLHRQIEFNLRGILD